MHSSRWAYLPFPHFEMVFLLHDGSLPRFGNYLGNWSARSDIVRREMAEWNEAQLVRRVRTAVYHLSEARWQASAHGLLPHYLKQLAADAILRWTGGTSEDDWIRQYHINAMEREYLEGAGVWPWGRDSELDNALQEVHMETAAATP